MLAILYSSSLFSGLLPNEAPFKLPKLSLVLYGGMEEIADAPTSWYNRRDNQRRGSEESQQACNIDPRYCGRSPWRRGGVRQKFESDRPRAGDLGLHLQL